MVALVVAQKHDLTTPGSGSLPKTSAEHIRPLTSLGWDLVMLAMVLLSLSSLVALPKVIFPSHSQNSFSAAHNFSVSFPAVVLAAAAAAPSPSVSD